MYQSYVLPPGSVISMSNFSVAPDETLFPDSFMFRPERWLHEPKAPDGSYLSRYMVSFGRGARSCLGIALAYAEIYIALATVFRRGERSKAENIGKMFNKIFFLRKQISVGNPPSFLQFPLHRFVSGLVMIDITWGMINC